LKTNKIRKIALLAGMAAILMYIAPACNKERNEEQLPVLQQDDFTGNEELVNRVLNFSQIAAELKDGKMQKSGEKMLIDNAIYYISATLNYIYCNHTAAYGKIHLDTITFSLPVIATEGKAYLVDALDGYNTAVEKAREKFVKINKTERQLINIAYISSEMNLPQKAVDLTFEIQTGTDNAPAIAAYGFFDVEEQYWWFRDTENCYNGNPTLGGAPNVLEQHILFKYKPVPPPNCRYWFPFTEPKDFIATDYEGDGVPDYFCDYKIFYAYGPVIEILTDTVQCLGLEANHPGIHEMDYYLNGLDEILSGFLANTGKSIATINIKSEIEPDPNNYTKVTIKHLPHLTFGKKMTVCWEVPNNNYPISIE
jgi:hypothetical protein